jgi:predicted MFS family arabinose efflux permease
VILHFGIPMAFTINAASFFLVIYALTRLPATPRKNDASALHNPVWRDLTTGLTLVRKHPGLRQLALMLTFFMFLSAPLQGLLAVFVTTVLHGDSQLYGLLLGAIGIGAVCGVLVIGRIPAYYPRHHLIPLAMCMASVAIIAFSFTYQRIPAFAALLAVGFFYMLTLNSSNAATQLLAEDPNRGRILSVILLCNQGALPVGHLFAAALTHILAPVMVIRCTASTMLVIAAYFLIKREPAIDAMQRQNIKLAPLARIWEAITAQSHRKVPEDAKRAMAEQPGHPSDLTPHG